MNYRSLLAHLCVGRDNTNVLAMSAQLAGLFGAQVTGIAGARLTPPFTEVPVADMMEYERQAAETSLKALEDDFRKAFAGHGNRLSWCTQCDYEPIGDFVARQARSADLIVTGPESKAWLERLDETRLGPLVLQAGRPVLVVPEGQHELKLRKAVVAWKDTREARRAAADALPLLQKAESVLVLQACPPDEIEAAKQGTADVVAWLKLHGISARAQAEVQTDSDLDALYGVLRKEKCDLVVAGAYGHTRAREWIFGGVTMDLLLPGSHCVLLSH